MDEVERKKTTVRRIDYGKGTLSNNVYTLVLPKRVWIIDGNIADWIPDLGFNGLLLLFICALKVCQLG